MIVASFANPSLVERTNDGKLECLTSLIHYSSAHFPPFQAHVSYSTLDRWLEGAYRLNTIKEDTLKSTSPEVIGSNIQV